MLLPLPIALAAPGGPGIALDIYLDTSQSNRAHAAHDRALVAHLVEGLGPDDLVGVSAFDGEVRPLAPLGAPGELGPALDTLAYTGVSTFYAPVLFEISARLPTVGARAHVNLIVSDAEGSDPENKRRRSRPTVADPNWRSPAVSTLGDARVVWLVRDARNDTPTPSGALAGMVSEPGGLESLAVAWNPPANWTVPGSDLSSWVESLRPAPPPPEAPVEPPVDWGLLLRRVGAAAGALVVLVVALTVLGRGRAQLKRWRAWRDEQRATNLIRREQRSRAGVVVEPLAVSGRAEERILGAHEVVECGRNVLPPGIAWALPGAGFVLEAGADPRSLSVRSRSARAELLIERGIERITVDTDSPERLRDGDVLVDGTTGTRLARLRLPEPQRMRRSA